MKANTIGILKFKRLRMQLGVSEPTLIGHLELLWQSAIRNAPQGDIGRLSNEEIAVECQWDGDPDSFIASLIECRWIDVCDENRLVIHDWEDHAPKYVKGNLTRHGKKILKAVRKNQGGVSEPANSKVERATLEPANSKVNVDAANSTLESGVSDPTTYSILFNSILSNEDGCLGELNPGLQSLKDNPRFWSTWERFKTYHLQTWHKEIAGLQEETILIDLSKISVDEAIHRIETAIRKGWKGIHPVREQPPQNHSNESPVELAINPATQKPYCPVCQKRFRSKQKSGCYGCGRPDFKTFPVDGVRA